MIQVKNEIKYMSVIDILLRCTEKHEIKWMQKTTCVNRLISNFIQSGVSMAKETVQPQAEVESNKNADLVEDESVRLFASF